MTFLPVSPPRTNPADGPICARVTGVVLAGGAGRRMGGVDKGLCLLDGQPLALRTLQRLQRQVGAIAISANRHHDIYAQWCARVWPDDDRATPAGPSANPVFDGPLAGVRIALARSQTPLVQLAACDTPFFPNDLVATLHAAMDDTLDAVIPATIDEQGRRWTHPTFALLRRSLLPSLEAFLASGERKFMLWLQAQRHTVCDLPDHAAFHNFNTPQDLADFERDVTPAARPPAPA
ncbi:MAG: Molybdenum cofactor guanylyltransferase [Paracidovorax wautersii]|uniref:Molybdenum cofactor guanylyltransferase n=1 Tax=Paracidovorax wautersii TaxID=1177982 RepID=A0A7V8FRG2_9BURK|nr:MAG: Molybdenum cofactor guanylyltransferase [Paracidovorax wautersii]